MKFTAMERTDRLYNPPFGCPCANESVFVCLLCLQVRRCVVTRNDMTRHLDVRGVPAYNINNAKVLFLNPIQKRGTSLRKRPRKQKRPVRAAE